MLYFNCKSLIGREKLIKFYKEVFHCRSIGEVRDLKGAWLDQMTGIKNAHIVGEHLCLPGYDDDHPTLEIFSLLYRLIVDKRIEIQSACSYSICIYC